MDYPIYTHLISVAQLQDLQLRQAPLMIFDVSFDLSNPKLGREQYQSNHIPSAIFADLNENLSAHGKNSALNGGRHPLPTREDFAAWLNSVGFENGMQAVVYDRQNANFCGRLWWMLQWAGHAAVAVLDGGLQTWQASGALLENVPENAENMPNTPSKDNATLGRGLGFTLQKPLRQWLDLKTMRAHWENGSATIVDARAAARFSGQTEPLDPVAGHIPGALNRPFTMNIAADGRFKPRELLRAEFEALFNGCDPKSAIHHCGSGVSAVPNILALEYSGLLGDDIFGAQLFAGSWSEWAAQNDCPVERSV